jgi:hypothetical protein
VTARGALGTAAALAALGLLAGCGSSSNGDQAEKPPPVARPQDFPKPAGRTIAQMRKQYGAGGPVLAPSVSQLEPGTSNRFGFGLFDRARAQIADAPVVLYIANADGGKALGPFPAHYESLHVQPQFLSRTVSSDPTAAKSVYVADLKFPKAGRYQVFGLARLDDRLVAATAAGPALNVKKGAVPKVGERAPLIHTPTKASVGGDLAKIDTRQPHDSMHDVDYAAVLGKKPIMLLFATPQLCQSRVCGPVVDIAEQVKAKHPSDAAWIHMEIYNGNQIDMGFRPQVSAFHLPTEPWLFAIDRRGRVAARIEGAYSVRELEAALTKAVGR